MPASPNPQNYTVHKASVYFRPEGSEFYQHVGNAPSATYTPNVQTLDHYSAMAGVRQKDAEETIEVSATFSVTVDEITAQNIARLALGDTAQIDQSSGSGGSVDATSGSAGDVIDTGFTKIKNVTMPSGSGAEGADYKVDPDNGLITILSSGGAGTYEFGYDANDLDEVRLLTQTALKGGFLIAGQSQIGRQMKITVPNVSLSAQNDLSLIQDQDWMQLTFQGEVLRNNELPKAPFGKIQFTR